VDGETNLKSFNKKKQIQILIKVIFIT
jgi:hypothetical protein